jgi:hypothetical protein
MRWLILQLPSVWRMDVLQTEKDYGDIEVQIVPYDVSENGKAPRK